MSILKENLIYWSDDTMVTVEWFGNVESLEGILDGFDDARGVWSVGWQKTCE